MSTIDKIKLGIISKSSHFDKSHDVNTTSDFGFCQPILIDEVVPGSKIHLKTNIFTRLAPLATPTFGRVQVRTYARFIKMEDVCMPYKYMMAEKSVSSGFRSYVPTNVDYISNRQLFNKCAQKFWSTDIEAVQTLGHVPDIYMMYSFWISDTSAGDVHYASVEEGFAGKTLLQWLKESPQFNWTSGLNDSTFKKNYNLCKSGSSEEPIAPYYDSLLKTDYDYGRMFPLSFENGDYVIKIAKSNGAEAFVCLHLTKEGRRLFKIFNSLGIQFKYHNSVPLHLLFAYYKAWFDQFNPGRDTQWLETHAYRMIHRFYDYGYSLASYIDGLESVGADQQIADFDAFLAELPFCCYSLDLDPLTVCQQNPWVDTSSKFISQPTDPTGNENFYSKLYGGYPSGENGSGKLNGLLIKTLTKLYTLSNKESVLGKKVGQLLRVKYGISLDEQSDFIGSQKIQVNISDVMATSDTSTTDANGNSQGAVLGEYAGQGTGSGSSDSFKFDSRSEPGILVQLMCIVPFGGYSQADGLCLRVTKNDFYQPQFDSLGYEAVSKSSIFGSSAIPQFKVPETFGFRPRFFGYKYRNNLRNGSFALRSMRDQYMPFNLDRYFNEDDFILVESRFSGSSSYVEKVDGVDHQVNESLRYIGRTENYGNYDRIFYDQSGFDDNFIVHIVQEYGVTAPMLPISESYDTFDRDSLNNDTAAVDVQHS